MTGTLRNIWRGVAVFGLLLAAPALAGAEDDANAGLDAMKQGNFAKAVQMFTRAILSGKLPADEREYAYTQRGAAYLELHNKAAATLDFEHALKIKPDDQDAIDGLAQARAATGRSGAGGGGDPLKLAQEGMNALHNGDADRAVALFSRAIESNRMARDDLELAYVSRGQAYLKQSQYRHAAEDVDSALQIKQDDADAQAALVEALGKLPAPAPAPVIDPGACKKNMTSQGSAMGGLFSSLFSSQLGSSAPAGKSGGKTFTSFLDYQGVDRLTALAGLYRAVSSNSPVPATAWQFDAVSLHSGFLSAEMTPSGANAPITLEAHVDTSGGVTRVTIKEVLSEPLIMIDIKGSICRTLVALPR